MASPMTSPGEADLLATMEEGLWEVRVQWEWMQQKMQQPMSGEDVDRPPRPAAERPEDVALGVHRQQQCKKTLKSRCSSTSHGNSQKQEISQKDEPMKYASLWASGELVPHSSVATADSGGPLLRKGPSVTNVAVVRKGTSPRKDPSVSNEPTESNGTLYSQAPGPDPDDGSLRSLKPELLEFIECILDAVKYTSTVTLEEVNKLKTCAESFLGCETRVPSKEHSPTGKEKPTMIDVKLKSNKIKHKGGACQTESQKRRTRKSAYLGTRGGANQSECYSNDKRFSTNGAETAHVSCTCDPHRSQSSCSASLCKHERYNTFCNRNQDRSCECYSKQNDAPQKMRLVVHCCPCSKSSSHQNQDACCTPIHCEVEHSCPQNSKCSRHSSRHHCIEHLITNVYFDKEEEENKSTRNGNASTRLGCIQSSVVNNTNSEKQCCSCSSYNQSSVNCDLPKVHPTFGYVVTPTLQDNFQMTLLMLDNHFTQITCASESMLLQHHNILSAVEILSRVAPKSWMSWVDDLLGLVMGCLRSSSGFLCLCWETTVFLNDNRQRFIADSPCDGKSELVENCSDARDACSACLGAQGCRQFVPEHGCHAKCRPNMREQTNAQYGPGWIRSEGCSHECHSLGDQTVSNEFGRGSRGCKFSEREATEPSCTLEQANSFGINQTRAGEANPHTIFFSAGPEFWSRTNATQDGYFINQQGIQSNTRNGTDFKQTIDFTTLHRMGGLFAAALSKAHKIGEKLSQIKKTMDDATRHRSAAGKRTALNATRRTGCRSSSGSEEDMLRNCKCDQKQERSMANVTLRCVPRDRNPQQQMQEPRDPICEASRRTPWSSSSSSTQPRSHTVRLVPSRQTDKKKQKKFKKSGGRLSQSKHFQEFTNSKNAKKQYTPKKCSHSRGHKNYGVSEYLGIAKSCNSAYTEGNHSSSRTEATLRELGEHLHKAGAATNSFQTSDHPTALALASERVFCQGSECDAAAVRGQTEDDEYRFVPHEIQSSFSVFSDVTSPIKSSKYGNSDVSFISPTYAESQASISETMMPVVFSSLQSRYSTSADRSVSSSACGSSGPSPAPSTLRTKISRPGPTHGKQPLSSTNLATPSPEDDGTSGFSFALSTDESEPTMSPFCDTRFPPRNWLQLKREGEALLGEWRQLAPELLRARFMDQAKFQDPVPISSHDSGEVRGVLVSFLASVGSSLRGVVGEISLQHRQWERLGHLPEAADGEEKREAALTDGNRVVKEEVHERETRNCVTDPSNDVGLEAKKTDRNPELPSQKTYIALRADTTSSVSAVDNQKNVTDNDEQKNIISDTFDFPQLLDGRVCKLSSLPEPQRCQDRPEKQIRSDPCVIQENNEDSKSPVALQGALNEGPREFSQGTLVFARPDGSDHNSLQQPDQEKQYLERDIEEECKSKFLVSCKQDSPSCRAVRQQEGSREAPDLPSVVPVNQPPAPQTLNLSRKQQQEEEEEKISRKGTSSDSRHLLGPLPHKPEQSNQRQRRASSEYLHALATADALLGSHRTIFLKLLLLTHLDTTATLPRLLSQLGGSLLTCLEQSKLLVSMRPSLCQEASQSGPGNRPSAASCVLKRQEKEAGSATRNTAPPVITSKAHKRTNNKVKLDAEKRSTQLCNSGATAKNSERSLGDMDNTTENLIKTKKTFAVLEIKPNPTEVNPHYAGHALCYHHSAAMALAHQLAVLLLR